jgi:predicted CoA-binding protein
MSFDQPSDTQADKQAAKTAFVAEKTLALVGLPRTRGFGKQLFSHLRRTGYKVLPVNAQADSIDGERCYRRLDDLPEPVRAVVTVVPPAETEKIVEDCGRLGIRRIWMQQGSESTAAVARCQALGIAVVAGECLIMHTEGGFPHSVHRLIWKMLGRY